MYNEYEEMVKQAYEEAYDMAYEDAYEDVCNFIAKQAEAAEFDEMVKCAYDEICGMEKEALWDYSWGKDPSQSLVVKHLRNGKNGEIGRVRAALDNGVDRYREQINKNNRLYETLKAAKASSMKNGHAFGGKAEQMYKNITDKNNALKQKISSMYSMRDAITN